MQRLFATFPDGQPGLALLLVRVSLAWILLFHGLCHGGEEMYYLPAIVSGCAAVLLVLGLFTPFMALLSAASGLIGLFVCKGYDTMNGCFIISVIVALAMLGPGAYSVDARLYGRRQLIVPTGRGR
jgi:uncharacterized membrane protein YphA (DoxX/SURF4 family)